MMALFTINSMKHEGRSALSDAPVEPEPSAITPRKQARLQAWLARALPRATWAMSHTYPWPLNHSG